ncbi:MAPEG family protein [Sphingomonas bacterium]|uniref:MAPEG family protein n=1 Tax=Sphingomonas bacterium TaxID=1895847 RepID=UPI001576018C|nr:MAPEG family protein [Sphingomonas bacterium]
MILLNILWPTFALVLLVFVIAVTMMVRRTAHMQRVPPGAGDFVSRAAADSYFAPVDLPANNFASLFELPLLFVALVPLLLITRSAGVVQVVLAWLFVLTRFGHSYLHIVIRRVPPRFFAFLAGVVILAIMWVGFFVDMVAAAVAYHHAMNTIGAQL